VSPYPVKSAALPRRAAPAFWHAPTGRFRRVTRALNPLSAIGWYFVGLAALAAFGAAVADTLIVQGLFH
jgi:hypothetical protein